MIVTLPFLLAAALIAGGAEGPGTAGAEAPAYQAPAPNFDQTVNVTKGTRLTVSNQAGEVVMRTWDRDAVRVTAHHSSRAKPAVRTGDNVVSISAGGMGAIDFDITVPSWMAVKVSGLYNYIELNGLGGEVSAENVRGDIDVKGGRGFVTVKSIEGKIAVSDVQGKVSVTAVNDSVTVDKMSGELTVDATNGNVTLTNINASAVSVGTVNGTIRYSGPIADGGRYSFVTHNGTVRLSTQPAPNATFYIRSYSGGFSQSIGLKPQGDVRSGRRNTLVGGNGSAQVEIETFNGSVRISPMGAQ